MKKLITAILATVLFITAGCVGGKHSADDFITVDVTKSYPKKELILQDFMDVEYIPLETNDEFITQGVLKDVGNDIIAMTNRTGDGDIFIFDRSGKSLRKINRLGQGGEEYTQATEIVLDEDNQQLFVVDYPARKIMIYDLYGNFRKSFKFSGTDDYYVFTFNYDRSHLMCYRSHLPTDNEQSCHLLISKQDGRIAREIHIPFETLKTPIWIKKDEDVQITPNFRLTVPNRDEWILMNTSADTVYSYRSDGSLVPLLVRTPSLRDMKEEVFLFSDMITDRYHFMHTLKKEFDLTTMKGFPVTDLVYDKQEDALFEQVIYNGDFLNERHFSFDSKPVNETVAYWKRLEAFFLVEAYKEGKLKGKLKEIAATLNEESNPVIMLVKHKK